MQDILLVGNPLPFDKDIRDLQHSQELEQKTIVFKDGNDEYANIFLLKVGLNANNWGVDQQDFDKRADEFLNQPVLIDPDGIVHASNPNGTGKYPLSYILEKQKPLVAGLITKVLKYDTNNDGLNDKARGIMRVLPEKLDFFHDAIKKGINETSPTIEPLNINEPAQRLKTYIPRNVVFTKNGAYLEHAKVKSLCKGSETSCSNALAASWFDADSTASKMEQNEKNNVSLMQLLSNNSNMENDSNNTTVDPKATSNPNQPIINVYSNNPNQQQEQKTEQKPAEPTQQELEIQRLLKENKELLTDNISSLKNELAPIDLFEGKEEDQKAFHKLLGDDPKFLKQFRDIAKSYVPRMIALYQKSIKPEDNTKKDEKGNPLAATLDLPKFNNDSKPSNSNESLFEQLKKKSLSELVTMNKEILRGNND